MSLRVCHLERAGHDSVKHELHNLNTTACPPQRLLPLQMLGFSKHKSHTVGFFGRNLSSALRKVSLTNLLIPSQELSSAEPAAQGLNNLYKQSGHLYYQLCLTQRV